jgi:hypothetical protein
MGARDRPAGRLLPMPKEIALVNHADRRHDVLMPYAPAIVVRRGATHPRCKIEISGIAVTERR